jgi:Family of unknown function (DUF6236)
MGEAKRRKESEPFFGQLPKYGKGLIISNPIEIEGNNVILKSTQLDPLELRRSILFWDRLVWPASNGIYIEGGVDEDYLKEVGILTRPVFRGNGEAGKDLAKAFTSAFRQCESLEPGAWAMSSGENALIMVDQGFAESRGASVELFRAVPIPSRDVPLEEVLRFKERRKDEARAFIIAVDKFFENWVDSEDQAHQLRNAQREIEIRCRDLIEASRESKLPFRLSSWKVGFSFNPYAIVSGGLGKLVGAPFGMEMLGALLGAAASSIAIKRDIGSTGSENKKSAFRFASQVDGELF